MRSRLLVVLLLVVGLAPLLPSPAAAAGPVVRGQVLLPDGRPAAGLPVVVTERRGLGEVLTDVVGTIAAFGVPLLNCLIDEPELTLCSTESQAVGRTDAQGRFALVAPDGVGEHRVSVLRSRAGPAVEALRLKVDVPAPGVTLPALRLWSPRVGVAVRDRDVQVAWTALPGVDDVRYAVPLSPRRADGFTGAAEVSGTTALVDGRHLEDQPGTGSVSASAEVNGRDVVWTSTRFAYPAPEGRPPSRGRPCQVVVPGAAVQQRTCWLGNGVDDAVPAGVARFTCRDTGSEYRCTRPPVTAVVLDLQAVRRVGDVRVRGLCRACDVSTSTDRRTWSPLLRLGRDVEPTRATPRATRFVRVRVVGTPRGADLRSVRSVELTADLTDRVLPAPRVPDESFSEPFDGPGSNDLSGLSEVSVWAEPAPARTPAAAPRAPAPRPATAAPVDGDERVGGPALLGAAVLVAAVVGLALERRRHAPVPQPAGPSLAALSPSRTVRVLGFVGWQLLALVVGALLLAASAIGSVLACGELDDDLDLTADCTGGAGLVVDGLALTALAVVLAPACVLLARAVRRRR